MQLSRDELAAYLLNQGIWRRGYYAGTSSVDLGDNTGYIVTQTEPPGLRESQIAAVANPAGFDPPYVPPRDYMPEIASMVYVPSWRQAVKDADNGGGLVETLAMAGIGAAVGAAAWNIAGSLTPDGFSLAGAETEEITVSLSETGVSNVDEFNSWYADRFSTDPFATTADVNAGWSFDGGYAGVDWYNNAGVGEAPDIWGSLSNAADAAANVTKKIGSILTLGTAALGNAQRNLAQQQPNYTRAAGSMNLGLLAVAVIAWKLL